jgi:hypothetical protein
MARLIVAAAAVLALASSAPASAATVSVRALGQEHAVLYVTVRSSTYRVDELAVMTRPPSGRCPRRPPAWAHVSPHPQGSAVRSALAGGNETEIAVTPDGGPCASEVPFRHGALLGRFARNATAPRIVGRARLLAEAVVRSGGLPPVVPNSSPLEGHDTIAVGEQPCHIGRARPSPIDLGQVLVGRPTGDGAAPSDEDWDFVVAQLGQQLARRWQPDPLHALRVVADEQLGRG